MWRAIVPLTYLGSSPSGDSTLAGAYVQDHSYCVDRGVRNPDNAGSISRLPSCGAELTCARFVGLSALETRG